MEAVDGIIRNRATQRRLIHKGFSYYFGLFVFAIPCSLYACAKLSPWVNTMFSEVNPAVSVGSYLYIFFVVLYFYRILFGYTKWAFPAVELVDNRDHALGHRLFWIAIVLSVLGNLIWSMIQAAAG